MAFKNIICKLGTMRKADEFVLYPQDAGQLHIVLIQSDKRCGRVDLNTGKVFLSSGKGGHPGFHMLSPQLGAKVFDVPAKSLEKLKALVAFNPQVGPVVVTGESITV